MICQAEWSKMLERLPNKSAIKLQFTLSREAALAGNDMKHVHSIFHTVEVQVSVKPHLRQYRQWHFNFHPWMMTDVIAPFYPTFCDVRTLQVHWVQVQEQSVSICFCTKNNHLLLIDNLFMFYLKIDSSPISWLKWTPLTHRKRKTPEVQAPFISLGAKKVPKIFGACVTTFQSRFSFWERKGGILGFYPSTGHTGQFFFLRRFQKSRSSFWEFKVWTPKNTFDWRIGI